MTTTATAPSTTAQPSRWPWIVLGVAAAFAAVGLVLVSLNGYSLLGDATNFIAFMGMGVVGALSLSRAPDNRIGWLLLWVAITVGAAFTTGEASIYAAAHGEPGLASWLAWPGNTLWTLGLFPLLILLPLVFPDGRLPSPRWRWLAWAGVGISFLAFVTVGFGTATFDVGDVGPPVTVANPLHIPGLGLGPIESVIWPMLLGLFVAAGASMVVRFRRSSGVERQQLKWFAFAVVALVTYFVISAILEGLGISEGNVGEFISGLAFLGIPIAVGISILQYRLWDLDVVVKKTLVAGSLVVLAIAVYAGAVALIGAVAVDRNHPALLFAIALALGIAFRPVMRIGRRLADRVVYGSRATPYEILSEFSERVGTSYATEDVLPRMAQVLGEGTGADVARIWLRVGTSFRPAATWPLDSAAAVPAGSGDELVVGGESVTDVRDQGEVLGALSVQMPASDPMTPAKEKLVRDLASQAGLVLRNVRLVEDLRGSRQRLVAAQDEERRRLERNIHDGAQQQLVALAVKARLARQLTERDPAKASQMLEQIEAETQTALEDLRDLARGIYPPLLADRGLVAAIEAQSRKSQMGVEMHAQDLGRFSADVEATVYFCTLEALQNVAKYASADHTVIRLARANGNLSFAVEDDGRGFDPDGVASGSGLQGMADRLAAVGGSLEIRSAPGQGTTVAGRVPVTAVHDLGG
jgi:signal transduction histidine kinase